MLPKGYKFKEVSAVKLSQALEAAKAGCEANMALALQRRKDYNANPNHCLECRASILVSLESNNPRHLCEVKKKRFCNRSCAGLYNMGLAESPRHKPKIRICSQCGSEYTKPYSQGTRCKNCKELPSISVYASRAKSDCIIQEIRSHARDVLFKTKTRKCEICGYEIRVDCCHIKPVKMFPSTALLSEVNAKENLIALCPNHHAELDLGILKLDSIGV